MSSRNDPVQVSNSRVPNGLAALPLRFGQVHVSGTSPVRDLALVKPAIPSDDPGTGVVRDSDVQGSAPPSHPARLAGVQPLTTKHDGLTVELSKLPIKPRLI